MSISKKNIELTETNFSLPSDKLYTATRAFILWLQGLFASRPKGCQKWHHNDNESEIIITGAYPEGLEVSNKRPIITVIRGAVSAMATSPSGTQQASLYKESTTYSDLLGFSISIMCISKSGVEAQELAYSVFRMLSVFKVTLIKLGKLHSILNNIQIGVELESDNFTPLKGYRMVSVNVPIYIQETIQFDYDFYTLLKEINIYIEENL